MTNGRDFLEACFWITLLVLWLLFSVAQAQVPSPPVIAGSSTGSGIVISITPPAPGLFYRINAWSDYPYSCSCLPPPALLDGLPCTWPASGATLTCTPSPNPPPQPVDVLSPTLTQNYTLTSGWTWNFWAQACTSQTDPNSCSQMSDILSIAL